MERYYFYIDKSGAQRGPMSLKNLVAEGITLSTMIWHDGMVDWQAAEQVSEVRYELEYSRVATPSATQSSDVSSLYDMRPPSYKQQQQQKVVVVERPKKWVIESILVTIFCCMPFGIVALVYALRAEDNWNASQYDEAMVASKNARMWVMVSMIAVLIYPLIYFFALFLGLLSL